MNIIEVLKGKQQIEEKISALEKEYKNKLAELKKKESFYQEREEFLMKGGSEEVLELTKYIKFYNFPYFLVALLIFAYFHHKVLQYYKFHQKYGNR